jgi:hypothetical protein
MEQIYAAALNRKGDEHKQARRDNGNAGHIICNNISAHFCLKRRVKAAGASGYSPASG